MEKFNPSKRQLKKEKVVTSIRLELEQLEAIDKASYETGISRNEFIVQCIAYALENMKK